MAPLHRHNPNKHRVDPSDSYAMTNHDQPATEIKPAATGPNGDAKPGATFPPTRLNFLIITVFLLVGLVYMIFNNSNSAESISVGEFRSLYESGQIKKDSVLNTGSAITAKRLPGHDSERETLVRIELNQSNAE